MLESIHLEYFSSPASLFAIAARMRQPRVVEFTCQVEGHVGAYLVRKGDALTATRTDKGLWAITDSSGEEFAALAPHDVNKLAGYRLVEG